jgi:hypothetical protein
MSAATSTIADILRGLEIGIGNLELGGLKLSFSLSPDAADHLPATADAWSLGPLAGANGTVRAQIVDAHLIFDANVTVPVVAGQTHFNDATVEHVGPDSRMGVSRMGLYVDAPNGRSYLYQFAAVPVAGVEFERRGALLGARVSDRGHLRLQEFAEGLLRQGLRTASGGLTEQSRQLFDRTSLSGEVRLGDGKFSAGGVAGEMIGRASGRNMVRLSSESVGHGLSAEIAALSVRNLVFKSGDTQLACDEVTGAITLRLFIEGAQVRVALEAPNLKLSGLRLQ